MKKIELNPYPFDLIYLNCTKEEAEKWVSKEIPEQVIREPDTYRFKGDGRTIRTDDGWILLWIKKGKEKDIGVIAHESFHVVEYLFNTIGLPHSETSSEAWAYMLNYIVNKIK